MVRTKSWPLLVLRIVPFLVFSSLCLLWLQVGRTQHVLLRAKATRRPKAVPLVVPSRLSFCVQAQEA